MVVVEEREAVAPGIGLSSATGDSALPGPALRLCAGSAPLYLVAPQLQEPELEARVKDIGTIEHVRKLDLVQYVSCAIPANIILSKCHELRCITHFRSLSKYSNTQVPHPWCAPTSTGHNTCRVR